MKASVWQLIHRAKESRLGLAWVDDVFPVSDVNDNEYCIFYPAKELLSYPQLASVAPAVPEKAAAIMLHFQGLAATNFVVYFEMQKTVMCFHPADLFPQFKRGLLSEITEEEIALFMKKIETIPEEKFWARMNDISRAHSEHGGLQTQAMDSESLGPDYFPDFVAPDPSTTEKANAIAKSIKKGSQPPPQGFTDEWYRDNADVFCARSHCGLNFFHLCCFKNSIKWLDFIDVQITRKFSLVHCLFVCLSALNRSILIRQRLA